MRRRRAKLGCHSRGREEEEEEDLDAWRHSKNLFWASRLPLPQLPRLCAISYSRERMARRQRPHCLLRGGRRAGPLLPLFFHLYIWAECVYEYTLEIEFLSNARGSIRCTPISLRPPSGLLFMPR